MGLIKGKVYLAGAGPGDHRLMTLRCFECLQEADVIVFDRLVNPAILSYARDDAEIIFAGKLPKKHFMKQDEINDLLVQKSREGKSVLRLKGGDPLIFGRGSEEALALHEHQIAFEIIPGISSAVAAPAYAGIPLTHRQLASSFSVITGHDADENQGQSLKNCISLAMDTDTLVFLMGMSHLENIVESLLSKGHQPTALVAIIQWGTTPEQKVIKGNLGNIAQKAKQEGISSPAVIVVSPTVALSDDLQWYGKDPLSGKRVMITRPSQQSSSMLKLVQDQGGEAWLFPSIAIAPPKDKLSMRNALEEIHQYHWIVFTSVNGVEAFFKALHKLKRDARSLSSIKFSAIGSKTAEALKSYGIIADYTPDIYTSEALVKGLKQQLSKNDRILIPRAEEAPKVFQYLKEGGHYINEVPAYRTIASQAQASMARQMLEEGKMDVLTFTSASTVTHFINAMGFDDPKTILSKTLIACIGPVTARQVRAFGLKVSIEAQQSTTEGLMDAILNYFKKEKRTI